MKPLHFGTDVFNINGERAFYMTSALRSCTKLMACANVLKLFLCNKIFLKKLHRFEIGNAAEVELRTRTGKYLSNVTKCDALVAPARSRLILSVQKKPASNQFAEKFHNFFLPHCSCGCHGHRS